MSELPEDVISVKQIILNDPNHDLSDIANKLILDSPEIIDMWKALEKKSSGLDDLWVWAFLETVKNALSLPAFHTKTPNERKELSKELTDLAQTLVIKLKANELDAHLIHKNGSIHDGFYLYEDFSESNQSRIDSDNTNKIKITELITSFIERTQETLANDPLPGKKGKNEDAIRFARLISDHNKFFYNKVLNKVTAVATNALFNTKYSESDITNLRNR